MSHMPKRKVCLVFSRVEYVLEVPTYNSFFLFYQLESKTCVLCLLYQSLIQKKTANSTASKNFGSFKFKPLKTNLETNLFCPSKDGFDAMYSIFLKTAKDNSETLDLEKYCTFLFANFC